MIGRRPVTATLCFGARGKGRPKIGLAMMNLRKIYEEKGVDSKAFPAPKAAVYAGVLCSADVALLLPCTCFLCTCMSVVVTGDVLPSFSPLFDHGHRRLHTTIR